MNQYSVKNIFAIAVLYKTEGQSSSALVSLNASAAALDVVLDVLVYDNSPQPQDASSLKVLHHLNCIYFHDVANAGVSKAYNYGAKLASEKHKSFVLLVDQDTHFPVESISRYIEAINTNNRLHQIFCPILQAAESIYSPTKYYFRRGSVWKDVSPGVHSLKNRNILNSGLLVNLSAFHEVGGYNEKIELYFSDFDFVARFARKHKEMVVIDLVCQHSISEIDHVDIYSALRRFQYYVKGSYFSIVTVKDYVFFFVTILLRSIKLSLRYKNMQFIQMFLKRYFVQKLN